MLVPLFLALSSAAAGAWVSHRITTRAQGKTPADPLPAPAHPNARLMQTPAEVTRAYAVGVALDAAEQGIAAYEEKSPPAPAQLRAAARVLVAHAATYGAAVPGDVSKDIDPRLLVVGNNPFFIPAAASFRGPWTTIMRQEATPRGVRFQLDAIIVLPLLAAGFRAGWMGLPPAARTAALRGEPGAYADALFAADATTRAPDVFKAALYDMARRLRYADLPPVSRQDPEET